MRLILLPGLDGTGELFSEFTEGLSKNISVTCINYPEQECLDYSELVEYVRSRLPVHEDFVLLAESFSGPIAFRLALLEFKHLQAIIFVASFLRNPNRRFMRVTRILPLAMLLRFSPPDFIVRKWLLGDEANNEVILKFKSILKRLPISTIVFRLRQIRNLSCLSGTISIPTYYIRAQGDRLVGESNTQDFMQRCLNLKSVTINGPHFILQSKAKNCANYVNQCVNELIKES